MPHSLCSALLSSALSALSAVNSIVSGANFHGLPLAIALDTLPIALTHIAGIAERRINWLLTASDSENPVNVYLSPQPGLHSGLMIAQYTAASLVNELQTLAHPSSIDTIPTSANQEDHVSMGATGALHLREVVERAETVLAIEALCAAQGLDFRAPLMPGEGVAAAHAAIRAAVPHLDEDRPPAPDVAAVLELIRDGTLVSLAVPPAEPD
jgi:histidine ammonia-lyase